jgi:hypothetical protein
MANENSTEKQISTMTSESEKQEKITRNPIIGFLSEKYLFCIDGSVTGTLHLLIICTAIHRYHTKGKQLEGILLICLSGLKKKLR